LGADTAQPPSSALEAAGRDINNIAANNVYIYQRRGINTPSALAGAAVSGMAGFAAGYVVGDKLIRCNVLTSKLMFALQYSQSQKEVGFDFMSLNVSSILKSDALTAM
jgi:hypothetical protein